MKVLVACEESQVVCSAFRSRGFDAFSCDLKPCSGGHPEWHFQADALEILHSFSWDLLIAHPPCTFLSNAGARYLYPGGVLSLSRYEKGLAARDFFLEFYNCSVPHIAIENPVPSRIFDLPPPSDCIQPWQFGDPFSKRTYLWLRRLPPLFSSLLCSDFVSWCDIHKSASIRSRTFPGVAAAMASQWGDFLLDSNYT